MLGGCPDQLRIVEDVPGLPRRLARPALVSLGLVEITFAGWVVSGARPRSAASAQSVLLALMNGGGLVLGT